MLSVKSKVSTGNLPTTQRKRRNQVLALGGIPKSMSVGSGAILGNMDFTENLLSATTAAACCNNFFSASTDQWPAAAETNNSKSLMLVPGEPDRQWNYACKQYQSDHR